jgi:hypothetical protein
LFKEAEEELEIVGLKLTKVCMGRSLELVKEVKNHTLLVA